MCLLTFFVKYLLFAVNLVFVLTGIALISTGAVVLTNIYSFLDVIPVRVDLIPVAVIVIGAIIFVIAFCGCCGSILEKRCLIVVYAVTMMITAALTIWLAVVLFDNLSDLRSLVANWLNESFSDDKLSAPFQALEASISCCGTTGPEAYGTNPLPPTCCGLNIESIVPGEVPNLQTCTIENAFSGCNDKLGGYFEAFSIPIAWGCIIAIVFQLVAMLAAFYLNAQITDKRNKRPTIF